MLKKSLISGLVAMAALAAGSAHAQSAGFGLSGTITPSPCAINLSGGGIAGYGTVTQGTVQGFTVTSGSYIFPAKSITIGVTCTTATKAELAVVDNKSAQLLKLNDGFDVVRFGIADGSGTTPIGGYVMDFATAPTLDGTAAAGYLSAPTGSTTWVNNKTAGVALTGFFANGYALGFVKAVANTVPDSFATLAGSLTFGPYVSKTYVDAATTAITLNGAGTITLQYL